MSNNKNLKVCCYCRVSTHSNDQLNSFNNQKSYFEREIEKNQNYQLVEVYADKGITGTSLNKREEFNRMLYDAGIDVKANYINNRDKRKSKVEYTYHISDRKPRFNLILTKNTSRFARNIMVIDIIRKLKIQKVYVHFLDINKTTENEADEMLLQLLFTMDENESKDKSRKVRFGHMEGARKGVIHTNTNIYGYKYISETNSLEIIPHEAEVIKKIFELYSKGYGIRRIINHLDENNIKTRKEKGFVKSTISRILQNEKYAGILVRNKYDTGTVFQKNPYPKVKPEEEWIIHKDTTPQIISEELFYKCKELRENKVNYITQKGVNKGISEYAGIIVCDKCGSNYTKNIDRGRVFYNCSLKKRKGTRHCDNDNISLKELDDFVDESCKGGYNKFLDISKTWFKQKLDEVSEKILQQIDNDLLDVVNQKKVDVEELYKKKDKLAEFYFNEKITEEYFNKKSDEFTKQINVLEEEIEQMNKTNEELFSDLKEIESIVKKIDEIEVKTIYTKEEILNEIQEIKVYKKSERIDGSNCMIFFKITSTIKDLANKYV